MHTVEWVANAHQKSLRFCSQASRKTQHFLVRFYNLFNSVQCLIVDLRKGRFAPLLLELMAMDQHNIEKKLKPFQCHR